MPPSSGEPWIWLTSVRPRSRRCSIEKSEPFGSTLIARPEGLVMRRRPRSSSRGSSKVRVMGFSAPAPVPNIGRAGADW